MNKRKPSRRRNRSRRRQIFINRVFLVVFIVVIALVIKNVWSLRSDKKNEDDFYNLIGTGNKTTENTKEKEIVEETKEKPIQSTGTEEGDWKATLKSEFSSNPNAKIVYEGFDDLPKDLKRMAGTNPDTVDFVAKYIDYSIKYKFDYPDKIYDDKKYPYYIQRDQKWGHQQYARGILGNAGCAPTSLAMMLSGMKNKKITPDEIADLSAKNGHTGDYGTNWDVYPFIGKEYGLKVTQVPNDINSIIKELDKGNPIVISVGPGTFTSVSHVMLIVDHDEKNNLKIYDPNNLQNSEKTWNLKDFEAEVRNMWAYSK